MLITLLITIKVILDFVYTFNLSLKNNNGVSDAINKSQGHERQKMKTTKTTNTAKTTGLKNEVLTWLSDKIESDYSEKQVLENLQHDGCISGMVSSLIYYYDTVKFYDKHKKEIINLIEDFCQNTGETVKEFFEHANNFPIDKKELQNETFVTGINGLIKKNKDSADQIKNWLSWFGFEEAAYRYYSEKYEQ